MDRPSHATYRVAIAAVVAGTVAWIGVVAIAAQLAAGDAASLGFDLELLLEAGRAIAAGRSPYDPALIAGDAPLATSLFYSYPPPVGQAAGLLAAVPSRVVHGLWSVGSVAGLLVVVEVMRRRLAPERSPGEVLVVAAACAPLTLPFVVGLLFGNLDVWFPLLYGVMVLAAVSPGRRTAVAGGVGLALASLKLHPASMGLWFLVRAVRDRPSRGPTQHRWVLAAAVTTGLSIVGASLLIGGITPWMEYAQVVRAGTQSAIVDPRNAGIAAQVALLIGTDDAAARTMHLVVGGLAVLVTAWAAWRRDDPLESVAWAAAASLATLPVTWYHYPSAMIPVAVAALLRADGRAAAVTRRWILAAGVLGAVAIAWLPLLWLAIGCVVLGARSSARPSAVSSPRAPLPGHAPSAPVAQRGSASG